MHSLVIGRGGLLGHNVEALLAPKGSLWRREAIDWSSRTSSAAAIRQQVAEFLVSCDGAPFSVFWCAGSGFVGTDERALEIEKGALSETLEVLASATRPQLGTFFFASSAGGVYAGVGAPPYDEYSPVRPLTPYGDAKLNSEAELGAWSSATGASVLVGRIANLYGPGQNLTKAQGVISQVCRSYLTGRPSSIYVPLDTIRDYLYAPDCAQLLVDATERLRRESEQGPLFITKILASQRAITVGAVLGELRRIFKGSARIVIAQSPLSSVQASDLSLRSRVWSDLDRRQLTSFPIGVANTAADLLRHVQRGDLVA